MLAKVAAAVVFMVSVTTVPQTTDGLKLSVDFRTPNPGSEVQQKGLNARAMESETGGRLFREVTVEGSTHHAAGRTPSTPQPHAVGTKNAHTVTSAHGGVVSNGNTVTKHEAQPKKDSFFMRNVLGPLVGLIGAALATLFVLVGHRDSDTGDFLLI